MKTENLTSLERSIYGTNLINRLTIENFNLVLPQLKEHLNKKVCLASGNSAKNFKIELLSYSDKDKGQNLRTYIKFQGERVILFQDVTVKDKVYSSGGYSVNYYKNEIEIGTLKDGILISVENIEQLLSSYSLSIVFCAKEVKETKDKIEQLKSEVSKLERTVYQFKSNY